MAATWVQLGTETASRKSVQATTEAAPSGATEGVDITGVAGFHVYAEADVGETFDGSGSCIGFMYDPFVGWARASELDVSFVSADNGNRRVYLGTFPVSAPRGRVAHICDTVGVSGGGVTLYYTMSGFIGERM